MRIRRIRVRKEYRLKFWSIVSLIFIICLVFIPKSNRAFLKNLFSDKCINYQQVYSRKLNDRIVDYSAKARLTGITALMNENDIRQSVIRREIVKVRNGRNYKVENLTNSYPYLTRDSKKLLKKIGRRFRKKISSEGFKGSKFIITSMTRTKENTRNLGKSNINVSENSPHLNGNAFDISYARFSVLKFKVTDCDKWYLKEALAEVIFQLKTEQKCWATYEKQQGCFHVVSR
ncbi:MAG: hypothetical protein GX999_06585 [Bacteroidales bacterium]|jgi:uncharacterized protein YcbK (DUF882 family)|nr:hypothetical protein [Bacteroidales bacterium]